MDSAHPNVLLIHAHDLGQYLGCYGVDVETPAIDALAAEGALFENHFATAPQCSPSRGSLMTGRYPHANGLMGLAHEHWELHEDERILPHYLARTDYETHLFGLQHITQDTDRLRYDHVHSEGNLYPGVSPEVHQANRARNVASVFSSFLRREAYDAPFFASIGFFECHRVEGADGRYGFQADYYGADDPEEVSPLPYLPDRWGIRHDLAAMRGMVHAIDDGVGTILEALDDTGLADETIVVFTTEHGIAFPRAKGSCYDAGIEAALIIRGPIVSEEERGQRRSELVSNVDVLPTILACTGRDVPDHLHGRDLCPLMGQPDEEFREREQVFAEMTWHDLYNPVRALRTERYKYVRSFWHLPKVYLPADVFASESGREVREAYGKPSRPYVELYDLQNSPQEDDNVAFEPRYQDVRRDLSRRLYEWMDETDDPLLDGPILPGDMDAIYSWSHRTSEG